MGRKKKKPSFLKQVIFPVILGVVLLGAGFVGHRGYWMYRQIQILNYQINLLAEVIQMYHSGGSANPHRGSSNPEDGTTPFCMEL